jgi:hypothetical protein
MLPIRDEAVPTTGFAANPSRVSHNAIERANNGEGWSLEYPCINETVPALSTRNDASQKDKALYADMGNSQFYRLNYCVSSQ